MTELDAREATIHALDLLGDAAARLGSLSGPLGLGLTGAAALLKVAARAMRDRGESVETILQRVLPPRDLHLPWSEGAALEDTQPAKPSSKKGGA